MRAFLRRNYLWPVFPDGFSQTRLRWVLWRWWTWPIQRWHLQRTCREHEPVSVRVGRMSEFMAGGNGNQRVICIRCLATIRDFSGMRALVDRHHADLFYSLQLLFADRLGVEVFTPVGLEWWDAGYWRFGEGYGDDRLARQFLLQPVEGLASAVPATPVFPERYEFHDGHHPERRIWAVTLEQARTMKWDYVVATVQDNQQGFARFAAEQGARYVLQVGNTNQYVDWSLDPLALVSSEVPIRGRGLVYHQEIDTAVFRYREPDAEVWRPASLSSFVNCFASTPCQRLFDEVRSLLPELHFFSYGIDGPDGNIERVTDIADLMASSAFGWHDKAQGDGFGHVIWDWAAIGRPLIGHAAHYRGLMAEGLWQDMVTCVDLGTRTVEEAAGLVRDIVADRGRHEEMCRAIRAEFDRIDYGAEADAIRGFLR